MDNLKLAFSIFVMVSIYLVHIYIARSAKNRFSKVLSELTLSGTVSAVSYCLFIMMTSYFWAYLAVTLYCIAIDWMVYFVFVYVLILTEAGEKLTALRVPFKIAFMLDSVDLLFNLFVHHRFELLSDPAKTTIKHFYGVGTLWNDISSVISYGVTLLTLGILVYKIFKAGFLVRKRYLWVLVGYSLVLLINVICVVGNTSIDYSILFYFLGAMFLWYGTAEAFPKQLMKDADDILIQSDRRMVMYFDQSGHCLFANKQAEQLFGMKLETGYLEAEAKCEPLLERLDTMSETDAHWEEKAHWYVLDNEGEKIYTRYYIWYLKDRKKRRVGYCIAMEDRTKEREEQIRAKYRDSHDDLTHVLNREGFLQAGREYVEENADKFYNVISVNIRNFKLINTMFGTEVGDRVLKNLAEAIGMNVNGADRLEEGFLNIRQEQTDQVRAGVPIGRMGGDRFAFMLDKADDEIGVISAITEHSLMPFEQYHYRLELVFGICRIDSFTETIHSFYNKATLAAQSVAVGKSENYAYYDSNLMQDILHDKLLVDAFDDALQERQFCIYIQPQYDAHGKTNGGEALVRWIHPDTGMIEPGEFIGVFERAGCIHRLDLYVWEEAVKTLKRWQEEGRGDYYLSVNISVVDFFYLNVYDEIVRLSDEYEIDRRRLKLEITESVMMNDAERVLNVLEKLRAAGYTIEVDDFGSGFSSLNRLKDIPADALKMDMGFLAETKNLKRRHAIMDTIIYLGKRLGMSVIAEGLESEDQYKELAGAGCEFFQGYYFSKPIPVSDFEEILERQDA